MSELKLKHGTVVGFEGRKYLIINILDLSTVIAKDVETGESRRLLIKDLTLPPADSSDSDEDKPDMPDIAIVTDEDWQEAINKLEIIRPLLYNSYRTVEMVDERANLAGVHRSTVYRWTERYENNPRLSVLLPEKCSGGKGGSRLQEEVVSIMDAIIDEVYLHRKDNKKKSVQKTCDEVIRGCKNANLPPPHPNTVRKRITVLAEKDILGKRTYLRENQDKVPKKGPFPGADWPLSVVQIDHTPLDIILVDDIDRLPIDKPWITLAICVNSRVIPGFYVSFDAPSALSVGVCISHAILPKEKWLTKHDIANPWPVWGKMGKIHVDNAMEFHSKMLDRACSQYGINIEYRPVGKPNFGGHIERLCGTLLQEIHDLPGTTFSNPRERGDYDSEKHAVFTLSEFEKWLAEHITGPYHHKKHSELGTSPLKKYEEGIFGTKDKPGSGLPSRVFDEERLRLDFLPYWERTVQDYGIVIDEIHYYSNVLSPWIDAIVPETKQKRKFICRRDPRDISVIYFFDPEMNEYYEIPYRDTSRPPISIWEWRKAQKRLKDAGVEDINEDLIFESYERMKAMEEEATRKTKKARRENQKRREHQKAVAEFKESFKKEVKEEKPAEHLSVNRKLKPFAEIEEGE